ncbi:TPA: D,D-heptose 1,7-bisphosphate phosphatase [Candidatus Komeilibacteria bacterium]|nr:MAG: hypothetical protein UW91_C0012G0023 [Parcubacteria group bacterium GW2011_GWF2_45_11]KKT98584.1 MAG: hypothetical protein UW98_C0006G0023 [Parcubacteria group bacterium GW2011_GWC2_45_15]HAH04866.1 D,D-heptose 1,7-bisphosphate phosphatase [Candidatus Komeilibacteria bacterium]HBR13884.1 D,D-heptose 1,7-bisphosphate phosphatase [Candidatus Komeilibacteria bacterium]HBV02277.1 D,D-heptose 1,7-bisphosphate phosphatase [Candidatus Komeilibacteria bacterium]
MRVFILAGGKGTKLASVARAIPKPLVKVAGKPILEYQIELCQKYGLTEITILIHHLGEQIMDYFADGRRWGVKLRYFREAEPLGTAGAFQEAEIKAEFNDDALIFYGDVLMNLNLRRLIKFHQRQKALATLVTHPNDHPFDSDLVEVDEQACIRRFLNKPHASGLSYNNLVSAACYVASPRIIDFISQGRSQDFAKDIFPQALAEGQRLAAYRTAEYLKDVGTPERLAEATRAVNQGIFALFNFDHPRPAIFLDRDGVITEETFQKDLNRVAVLPGVAEGLRQINRSAYLAVVISNQAAVAKGFCTYEDVLQYNKKMETLLGNQGAKLDGLYFCPHIPDRGFPGENLKYKIECACRKPKIGMIEQAVKDYNIDLSRSYFIGDATVDALTAENAGIKFVGVKTGYACREGRHQMAIKEIFDDFQKAVAYILSSHS